MISSIDVVPVEKIKGSEKSASPMSELPVLANLRVVSQRSTTGLPSKYTVSRPSRGLEGGANLVEDVILSSSEGPTDSERWIAKKIIVRVIPNSPTTSPMMDRTVRKFMVSPVA